MAVQPGTTIWGAREARFRLIPCRICSFFSRVLGTRVKTDW